MSFIEDLKKPFNIITILLALGSIFIAMYFYYNPKKDKNLSYIVAEPQQIYDAKIATSNITLLDSQKNPIQHNVYVTTVTLWNSGSEAIEPSDNRKPFLFKISNCYQVIDHRILKEKDKDVTGFALSSYTTKKETDKAVGIDWRHFDPKHGLSFQVIYAALPNYTLSFDTEVLGLESISDARPMTKRYSIIALVIGVLLYSMAKGIYELMLFLWRKNTGWKRYSLVSFTAIVTGLTGYVIYTVFMKGNPPPF